MTTVTVDILDDKALNLLKDLELLKIIKVHLTAVDSTTTDSVKKYKGLMTKQSPEEIEQQLNELRNEWD